ncbi:MAG: hypothetical protein ACR2HG_15190 [Pyrinomonadaceae bacterium]
MSKIIEPNNWQNFLKEFSGRNKNRRARFQIFTNGEANEEEQEARLQKVSLKKLKDGTQVVVTRVDKSEDKNERMVDTLADVHGLAVQYEKDGSENILEITNKRGDLTLLRFESMLDGVS